MLGRRREFREESGDHSRDMKWEEEDMKSVKLKNQNCVMAKEKGNVNSNPQTMFSQLDLKITSRNF